MMQRCCFAFLATFLFAPAANAVVVTVSDSTGPWLGFMKVTELDGTPAFESGWGVSELVADFDDTSNELTLSPNTINDPNEFWYQNTTGLAADPTNPGGPGQAGNKIMEANLFIQVDDALSGQNVTFEGTILSNTFTGAHEASLFIRDYAPDFLSLNEIIVPVSPGPFSISLMTDPGAGRHVQYGFQAKGENVWATDVAPFGAVVIETISIPEPASVILAAFAVWGRVVLRRR